MNLNLIPGRQTSDRLTHLGYVDKLVVVETLEIEIVATWITHLPD